MAQRGRWPVRAVPPAARGAAAGADRSGRAVPGRERGRSPGPGRLAAGQRGPQRRTGGGVLPDGLRRRLGASHVPALPAVADRRADRSERQAGRPGWGRSDRRAALGPPAGGLVQRPRPAPGLAAHRRQRRVRPPGGPVRPPGAVGRHDRRRAAGHRPCAERELSTGRTRATTGGAPRSRCGARRGCRTGTTRAGCCSATSTATGWPTWSTSTGDGLVEHRDTETFDQAPGSGPGAVPNGHFSPPTLTQSWFHPGPVAATTAGDWTELDLRHEYWDSDPSVLGRPAEQTALLAGLPRDARRTASRALRGQLLRTELYALDDAPLRTRPYTVTETVAGVREESPPAPGEPRADRDRISSRSPWPAVPPSGNAASSRRPGSPLPPATTHTASSPARSPSPSRAAATR